MTSAEAQDSEWVRELFAASACDWTPAALRSEVRILYMPFSRDPQTARRCTTVLAETERQRADRFVTEDGKEHFLQRRAFRRYCGELAFGEPRLLSEIIFQETEKGQPSLPDLPDVRFSFSSCRFGFLGAWSATRWIGIDIEDQTRKIETAELARQFFSAAEAEVIKELCGKARHRTFFQLWSLKEAALKSIGEGLPYGLDAFAFELIPKLRVVQAPCDYGGPERFNACLIEGSNTYAALVTRSLF